MPEQLTMLDEIVWTRGCDGIYSSAIGTIEQISSHGWVLEFEGEDYTKRLPSFHTTLRDAKIAANRRRVMT